MKNMRRLARGTVVRASQRIVRYGYHPADGGARHVATVVPKGTYGIVRYWSEGANDIAWLLRSGPACFEACRGFETVDVKP